MKKLFFLFLLTFRLSAQTVDNQISLKVDSLRKEGVDTFMVYHTISYGSILFKTDTLDCIEYVSKSLFWQVNNHIFVQLFDNCYQYSETKSDTLKSLVFYKNHLKSIHSEVIKPPERRIVIKRDKKGKVIKEEIETIYVDHTTHHFFQFLIKNKVIDKDIDSFHLNFEKFDNDGLNDNWAYNQSTKLKTLIELTEKETEQLKVVFEKLRKE